MDVSFDDLRGYIDRVKEIGECKVIEEADWDLEIGVISELYLSVPDPPLLLFDKIRNHEPGYRIISNLLITPKRAALALGLPLEAKGIGLVQAWREKSKEMKLIPPAEVKTGPIYENIETGNDINLLKFPTPKWHELDGGRYIGTGCMVIQKHPDEGWVNIGTYRVQVHDRDTATIFMVPGRHGDLIRKLYWERGLGCPAAVCLGQEPLLWSISSVAVPWHVSEYDYAGGLKGQPVEVVKGKVTGLPIPATAEIVLEGEILPPDIESRMEGPFGEWTGYYASGTRAEPAFKVKAVLHRNNPIIMGVPPMGGPDSLDRNVRRAAIAWDYLDNNVPNIKGVWVFLAGVPWMIAVISIKQSYGGHAKQTLLSAAGCEVLANASKYIIVVDDDIDPTSTFEVLWALATRSDPAKSIDIIRDCWAEPLDPIITPDQRQRRDFTHSVALISACKPFDWINEFPASIKSSRPLLERVNKKWGIIT